MTHHPHVHGIVPGGGLSADGEHWIACRPGFFLPVRVLSRLFRRLFLEKLLDAYQAGKLQFYSEHQVLEKTNAFIEWINPLRKMEWVVYAKRPFAGPAAVLSYLSRYTHRIAIANSRLIALDKGQVTFKWKDYRNKGRTRHKRMTLTASEFIRRFLLHILPAGFHRIRHYGLIANTRRRENLARARALLIHQGNIEQVVTDKNDRDTKADSQTNEASTYLCRHCGAPMIIIETFVRGQMPRAPPTRIAGAR